MNPDRRSEAQGSKKNPLVDLVTAYSKRPDLLDDLDRAVCQTAKTRGSRDHDETAASPACLSQRLVDRLGEQIIGDLLRDRRSGASKQVLAERYGISLSSVKRLLRRH
jgi:hypothetical protein